MGKRYIHGAVESVLIEDGSAEHEEMLESGEWFNNRCDIPANDKADVPETEEEVVAVDIDYAGFTDEEIVAVYNTVDAEMEKRGLFDGDAIHLDELTISELRALAQKYKIPGFSNMKHETLIKRLTEVANA